ncbi:MAG: hypothetical protein C5B51_01205 [Terriglobia bacterium]|nr:MAG: hypothetical protein C5B51_01205 [Terriglobia bacterium]
MRLQIALFLVAIFPLAAADEQQLALTIRAQSDFDRVEASTAPQIQDTARCIQSQAALLAVAAKPETALVHFRKGYCTLAEATITGNARDYSEAAGEFDRAIEAWPDRTVRNGKNPIPDPVSSGLRVLDLIAKLKAQPEAARPESTRQDLSAAIDPPVCAANLMPINLCEGLIQTGRQWLGWMALRRDDLYEAGKDFAGLPANPWERWIAGRRAFEDRNYKEAAARYREAVDLWKSAAHDQMAPLPARLSPQPDMAQIFADFGGAQLLSSDPAAAIASLDASIKADPNRAHSIYLRARARELLGQTEQALADYSLASRTAFANAADLASGEAHLYRGVLMYRRKDYVHAEDEFSSALNFEIAAALRPDAAAWRHMAAVANGACAASRTLLEESLAHVSPYFPKDEARKVAANCPWNSSQPLTGSVVR